MNTSNYWVTHFKKNAKNDSINWDIEPNLMSYEVELIRSSLQAWQLGETSEGSHLVAIAESYSCKIADPEFSDAMKLFIKEEQRHGENLGRYLDVIGVPRIKKNWGDSLFRNVRHLNTNIEMWTLAVIAAESSAQVFYQALNDFTYCTLLKEICADILVDEAHHITFQTERLAFIYNGKSNISKGWRQYAYKYFFYAATALIWFVHRHVFIAGGISFEQYFKKITFKYLKICCAINALAATGQSPKKRLAYNY